MGSDTVSRSAKHLILSSRQFHIAKSSQLSGIKSFSSQNPCHWPVLLLHILHALMQIHKTATLCQIWQSSGNLLPYILQHFAVLAESLGI